MVGAMLELQFRPERFFVTFSLSKAVLRAGHDLQGNCPHFRAVTNPTVH